MTGAMRTQSGPFGGAVDSFDNEFSDHLDETGIDADGCRALHSHAQPLAKLARLGVEVEQDLHMIRDKANRYDHQFAEVASRMQLFNPVADVGLQPRLVGRTATALVNKFPLIRREAGAFRHQSARFGQLNFVAAVLRHGERNAVGGEENLGPGASLGGNVR
jgi:hypothetical protein